MRPREPVFSQTVDSEALQAPNRFPDVAQRPGGRSFPAQVGTGCRVGQTRAGVVKVVAGDQLETGLTWFQGKRGRGWDPPASPS